MHKSTIRGRLASFLRRCVSRQKTMTESWACVSADGLQEEVCVMALAGEA